MSCLSSTVPIYTWKLQITIKSAYLGNYSIPRLPQSTKFGYHIGATVQAYASILVFNKSSTSSNFLKKTPA